MKLSNILLFAAGVQAQVAVFRSILTGLQPPVKSLDNLVKAYTGGNGGPIFTQASKIITTLRSDITLCSGATPLTQLAQALSLLTYCTPLLSSVKTLASDLISKESLAAKNGIKSSAESILIRESRSVDFLASCIVSKLQGPATAARGIASTSCINPILTALDNAIAKYA